MNFIYFVHDIEFNRHINTNMENKIKMKILKFRIQFPSYVTYRRHKVYGNHQPFSLYITC